MSRHASLIYCILLLSCFATISYLAVCTKSATSDEVVHAPAAYTHLRYFDFRVNPEHPPLWKYLAALPWLVSPPADPNVTGPAFADVTNDPANHWAWAVDTLYHTPGNNPVHLLALSRAAMLFPALALGALLSYWSYQLAGSVAGCIACTLYCLDPNFLAHGPLVTNDVSFTAATLLFSYSLYLLCRKITFYRIAFVAIACGIAFTTKFTAILLAPALVLTLLTRAFLPIPWSRHLALSSRLLTSVLLILLFSFTTYFFIWSIYGFRFRSSPDPSIHPDLSSMTRSTIISEFESATSHVPTDDDIRTWPLTFSARACLFTLHHHLLPEPYAYGFLFAYANSLYRWSFCLGQVTGLGHWYYFPLAFLTKTPLATLLALLLALASVIFAALPLASSRSSRLLSGFSPFFLLSTLPVFLLITYFSLRSHMNLGLRHIFPLYPFLYVFISLIAAKLYAKRPKILRPIFLVLFVTLAAESLSAYPDFIPFFNVAAGGYRGGFHLLGDSNLDWGQDLPALAQWQQTHPDRTLYLAYTGSADPAYYHIRFIPLTLNTGFQITRKIFPTTGVVAASATMLQTDWLRPQAQSFFHHLRDTPPTQILGGSIYLFDLDHPPR